MTQAQHTLDYHKKNFGNSLRVIIKSEFHWQAIGNGWISPQRRAAFTTKIKGAL